MKTADELVAEGRRELDAGRFVVLLHPAQEWMAVQLQQPFLRYQRCDLTGPRIVSTAMARTPRFHQQQEGKMAKKGKGGMKGKGGKGGKGC